MSVPHQDSSPPLMARASDRALRSWWLGRRQHFVIAAVAAVVAVIAMRALAGGVVGVRSAPVIADVLMFFGVFVGVFATLLWIDTRVRTPNDIARIGRGELLGIIPQVETSTNNDSVGQINQSRAGAILEAFGRLYRNAKLHSKNPCPKIVAVCAHGRREGKQFVAANFAASCAQHGRRTLLIDADARSQRLTSIADLRAQITSIADNLDHLFAPTSVLLESTAVEELLAALKAGYEFIVIDTPPMSVAHDAVLIADHCDEILYVCGYNRVSRRRAAQCLRALHNGKNEILGIVLNGLPRNHMEYLASDRSYHSYKQHYGESV